MAKIPEGFTPPPHAVTNPLTVQEPEDASEQQGVVGGAIAAAAAETDLSEGMLYLSLDELQARKLVVRHVSALEDIQQATLAESSEQACASGSVNTATTSAASTSAQGLSLSEVVRTLGFISQRLKNLPSDNTAWLGQISNLYRESFFLTIFTLLNRIIEIEPTHKKTVQYLIEERHVFDRYTLKNIIEQGDLKKLQNKQKTKFKKNKNKDSSINVTQMNNYLTQLQVFLDKVKANLS